MELWIAAFLIASVNALVFLVAASLALYRTWRRDRPGGRRRPDRNAHG